ncbi:Scr1 family TA system antitoxin-like transcriptional regulator [Microbispora sp. NPDC046933]|uniref:Scr1 family TA system antitoxin-like transcriptional regulator n=1 Tax=Microbispora sp. NPDC046933 TaxID=3155618 RepID=UPI0033F8EB7D
MRRGRILSLSDPPRYSAFIDEAALRRVVAGPAVMATQLEHLLAVAQEPHVTVQVIPFAADRNGRGCGERQRGLRGDGGNRRDGAAPFDREQPPRRLNDHPYCRSPRRLVPEIIRARTPRRPPPASGCRRRTS